MSDVNEISELLDESNIDKEEKIKKKNSNTFENLIKKIHLLKHKIKLKNY